MNFGTFFQFGKISQGCRRRCACKVFQREECLAACCQCSNTEAVDCSVGFGCFEVLWLAVVGLGVIGLWDF